MWSINNKKHNRNFFFPVKPIFLCLIFSAFFNNIFGQSNYQVSQGNTAANLAPGTPAGSYALNGFESVNPYSGKMNFSLPLLKIGGRGNAGYTMNLNIQKNWTVLHNVRDPNTYRQNSEQYEIRHNYTPTDENGYGNGLISLVPGWMKGTRTGTNRNIRMCGYQPCYDETLTRLSFVQTDGTEIEFRDILQGGKAILHTGTALEISRGTHWVSSDGTNATFISDTNIYDYRIKDVSDGSFSPSGILYLANGTKYLIQSGFVTKITDINGNIVTPGKDSLGREVTLTETTNPNSLCPIVKILSSKGTNGIARNIKICYSSLGDNLSSGYSLDTVWGLFPNVPVPEGMTPDFYNPPVVSYVELPDNRKYVFKYNNYGEITEIKLPTGGKIEYVWQSQPGAYGSAQEPVFPSPSGPPDDIASGFKIYRRVEKRRVYENNLLENETVYDSPEFLPDNKISVKVKSYVKQNNNLILISYSKHYYYGSPYPWGIGAPGPSQPYQQYPTNDPPFLFGKELETEIYNADNSLLRKTKNTWQPGTPLTANPAGEINPRLVEVEETLSDANLVSKKTFSFDNYNNQTDVYEYDYGNGQSGAFKRRTHTDFVTDTNYTSETSAHLRNLPSQTWVSSDINGTMKASLTQFEYDNYAGGNNAALVSRSNVIGHDTTNYGTNKTIRGNVTKVTTYGNAQNQTEAVSVYSNYDILGNVVKNYDAKGYISTIDYSDRFGTPDGEARSNTAPAQLNGQSTFAFPTSGTNALNWTVGYTQFDYFNGTVVNTEDANGVISKLLYNDPIERPTQSVTAVGTALEMQSNIIYDDANRRIEIKSDLNALNDNLIKSESFYDGLGRTIESRRYEADGGYIATKSIPFVVVQDPETSIWRVGTKSSNPYRSNVGEQPIWTTSLSDSLGRSIKVITPDGAVVKTEYSGNTVTITDQAGKKRRSIANPLGQLIRVDEPDGSGNLGSVDSPNQPTNYVYNTIGKMIEVTQGVQKRHFMYDSLGRLLRVRQPEQQVNSALNLSGNENANTQWTAAFSYDNNGNLLTATGAGNVTITNNYDALNRAVTRSYSDSVTPTVDFTYDDAAVLNSKGKLTKISSSISEMRYTSYDKMGRLLVSEQATDGQSYSSSYKYNLAGLLTEQIYPSGRIVKEFLANDGNLAAISSKVSNGQYKMHAANFSYTATGVIKHLQIGNGLWESAKLNSRQQITELNLGTSPTDGSKWQLKYDYGELDANGIVDPTRNSGNIAKQTISFSGLAQPFLQTYKYDSLDRISEARETNNDNQTWKQNWSYDRYGNRTGFTQDIGGQQLPANNLTLPQVDANTNRFQAGQGYDYDFDGNLIRDAEGRQFTFDGENKQTEVRDASNNVVGRYYYDGSGKRVKKITNSETVIFVYDGMGKLAAEYSTAAPVQNPTTNYTATDPLGSPRVITNKLGEIVSRRDFMPFGEQLTPDATYRTANLKYTNGDNIRQKFTGYERDEEAGLDFAEARYYNDNHGRFTAVDPLLASGKSTNPQTFNRYVYTMNRPLILTDSTGLQAGSKGLKPDPNIVVPENVRAEASRTTTPGTYQSPDGTSVENATLILPKSLVQLKKDLANFAYTHQAAATSQAIANSKTSDVSPNQGTVSNQKTVSKEKESSKTIEVNGELSTSPSLGGSASSTDKNNIGNSSSDGKQLTGPSTAITGKLNNLENQVNIAIGNYLNANSDRNGDLKIDLIDSSGNKHRGVKISRDSLEKNLQTFVQRVRNQADSDFGGQ